MRVGNIIKAYRKGYHIVTEIRSRVITEADLRNFPNHSLGDERPGLVTYYQIAQEDFTPVNRPRTFMCDAGYCHVVTQEEILQIIMNGRMLMQQVEQANGEVT